MVRSLRPGGPSRVTARRSLRAFAVGAVAGGVAWVLVPGPLHVRVVSPPASEPEAALPFALSSPGVPPLRSGGATSARGRASARPPSAAAHARAAVARQVATAVGSDASYPARRVAPDPARRLAGPAAGPPPVAVTSLLDPVTGPGPAPTPAVGAPHPGPAPTPAVGAPHPGGVPPAPAHDPGTLPGGSPSRPNLTVGKLGHPSLESGFDLGSSVQRVDVGLRSGPLATSTRLGLSGVTGLPGALGLRLSAAPAGLLPAG